MILDGEATSAI